GAVNQQALGGRVFALRLIEHAQDPVEIARRNRVEAGGRDFRGNQEDGGWGGRRASAPWQTMQQTKRAPQSAGMSREGSALFSYQPMPLVSRYSDTIRS